MRFQSYVCWVYLLVSYSTSTAVADVDVVCPHVSHMKLRARSFCKEYPTDHYSCLFDRHSNAYNESCFQRPDYVRQGQKYIISGGRKNVNCSADRYQPIKFRSNESSNCILAKTLCTDIGQTIFSTGSSVQDTACMCDFIRGFVFLEKPKNLRFCHPSIEDCSCYPLTCPENKTLSSDYECITDVQSTSNLSNSNIPAINDSRQDVNISKERQQSLEKRGFSLNHTANIAITTLISVTIAADVVMILLIFRINYKDTETKNFNQNERFLKKKKIEIALQSLETNEVQPDKRVSQYEDYLDTSEEDEIQENIGKNDCMTETRQSSELERFICDIGLKEFYPNKIEFMDAVTIRLPETKSNETGIAFDFIKNLLRTNYFCRDKMIYEYLKKSHKHKKRENTVCVMVDEEEEEDYINPLDIILAVFLCCSPTLKQILVERLFMCKLAVPFSCPFSSRDSFRCFPVDFHSINIESLNACNATPTTIVDCPSHVISFVRLGCPSISKSKLINDIINVADDNHNTFFNRDCPLGTSKRCFSDGLVEISWFIPSKKSIIFDDLFHFFNLRGDGKENPEQILFLSHISTIVVVILDISIIEENYLKNILRDLYKYEANVMFALDGNEKEKNTIIELYNKYVKSLGFKLNPFILKWKRMSESKSLLKDKMRKRIIHLVQDKEKNNLNERLNEHNINEDDVDEYRKVKELAIGVASHIPKKDFKLRENTVPLQGDLWISWSQLQKQLKMSSDLNDINRIKKTMLNKRNLQANKCKNRGSLMTTFIKCLTDVLYSNAKCVHFISYLKFLFDEDSYLSLHEMKAASPRLKENKQCISDRSKARLCIDDLFREMGQMYESIQETEPNNVVLRELPILFSKIIQIGESFEIYDGIAKNVPLIWIKAVLHNLVKDLGNKKMVIVSAIGIKGSGKSTFLNTIFGLHFPIARNKKKRGIVMQLLPVTGQKLSYDYICVIDSLGLRDSDKSLHTEIEDKCTSAFVIGISDIILSNIKGENLADIECVFIKALQVIHQFSISKENLHLEKELFFAFQNVSDADVTNKMALLTKMTETANDSHSQEFQLFNIHHLSYVSSFWEGDPPMAAVNPGYCKSANDMKDMILKYKGDSTKNYTTVNDMITRIEEVWMWILTNEKTTV